MAPKLSQRSRRILVLAAVGVAAVVLWDSPVLLPLKLVVVLFHELAHGLAALVTGGEILEIRVSADQGGMALTRGGNRFVVLSAGYLGSLLWGVSLLFLGKRPRTAMITSLALSLLLVVVAVAWMPWLSLGFALCVGAALALVALARWGGTETRGFVLRGIGVFSVLYALWDIRDDVLSWGQPAGEHLTDAAALAELTHIPAPCWGLAWMLAGVLVLVALRKRIV